MSTFNCSVHFFTLKQIGYVESNVSVTSYHDRTHFESNNSYSTYAEEFNLQQGRKFTLHNKLATLPTKISKFKDQIKELDELLVNEPNQNRSQLPNEQIENINHFFACYNSNIAKIIWLDSNRLLIVMSNSNLIWILFDTISGDLIKFKIDKTLTTSLPLLHCQTTSTSSVKQTHLSGKIISDALLVIQSESSSIVLAYSDTAKIDIIKLNKNSLLLLKHNKNQQIKKLKDFEPHLKTYEFALPNQYMIEKKLTKHDSNETFTVWWENSSLITNLKENIESTKPVSLLDRDDLRNNIQILSLDLNYDNLLEYLFKSDGNLLSISYLTKTSLIAVEQVEDKQKQYSLNIYRYNLPNESQTETKSSLKIKLISFELTSKIISSEQIKECKNHLIMLTSDQTIIIYEINRNLYRIHKLNPNEDYGYNSIEWLIDDLLFCVTNVNGDLILYDIGFNLLSLNYNTREINSFTSISHYLTQNIFTRFSASNKRFNFNKNSFQRIKSSRLIFTESLWSCFYFSSGPIGLFKISLTDNFNSVSLVNHFLKNSLYFLNNQNHFKMIENSVKLMVELDWDYDAKQVLSCLNKIINFILCEKIDYRVEQIAKRAFGSFFKPKKQLNEKTIYENKQNVCRLARRFFYKLLELKSYHAAYLLAVDIGAKDLFNDLYYCAIDSNETEIAEICRHTYHEMINTKTIDDVSIINLDNGKDEIIQDFDINDTIYSYYNENVYDFDETKPKGKNITANNIYSLRELEEFRQQLSNKIKI